MEVGVYTPEEQKIAADSYACHACVDRNAPGVDCGTFCIPGYGATYTDLSQDMTLSFSGNCKVSDQAAQDLSTKVNNDLNAKVSDKTDALGQLFANASNPGGSSSDSTSTDIKTQITAVLSASNLVRCNNALSGMQKMNLQNGSAKGLHQTMAISMIADTLASTTAGQTLKTTLDNAAASSTSKENVGPFTVLAGLFSSPGLWVVLGIVGLFAAWYFIQGHGGGGGGGFQMQQQPQHQTIDATPAHHT